MICPKCRITERYPGLAYCKDCYLEWQREYRRKNYDKVRTYARAYAKEYRKEYYKDPEKRHKAYVRSYTSSIVTGNRPDICPRCGEETFIESHHYDYDHWSHFVWLCKKCHMEEHGMANPERAYDKTHLSIDTAEERYIHHRDYLAHCLRWSHVCKFLMQRKRYASARILEAGCGREMPLPRLIYSNRMSGVQYVGIDMNLLTVPDMLEKAAAGGKMSIWLMQNTDAGLVKPEHLPWQPNIVVSFEVFEHVHPQFGMRMLRNLHALAEDGADFFFSTPCFNGSAAENHISETCYNPMGSILERVGWNIVANYGTFASQSDYLGHMDQGARRVFEELSAYYDSNLLAVIFAPVFPQHSRNCLWHCRKEQVVPHFPFLEDLPQPWGQHRDSGSYAD